MNWLMQGKQKGSESVHNNIRPNKDLNSYDVDFSTEPILQQYGDKKTKTPSKSKKARRYPNLNTAGSCE